MPSPWNIRTTPNPLIRAVGRGLTRLNARHPWDHNAHFRHWIERHLPAAPQRILDVGCGRGDLVAALAERSCEVVGLDPDPGMVTQARRRTHTLTNVRILQGSLAEHTASSEHHGRYDVVTMVASVHHMTLDEALESARKLLAPGGRLLVVTLVHPASRLDHAWDILNALTNPLIGLVKHPRPHRNAPRRNIQDAQDTSDSMRGPAMPVRDATFALAQLRRAARTILGPGAVIRRREGFRVTLRWSAPENADRPVTPAVPAPPR
ncbi:class I SAM-dependent methyltransferase [Brachybacterium sp. Marseille-Q7125]|uniref:class I SAM-dependent methyltransferase n=1 Tax=Brachybacterium sp. Marseille-Q7125 TaxID=2932815 RepID=UPI001FF64FC7